MRQLSGIWPDWGRTSEGTGEKMGRINKRKRRLIKLAVVALLFLLFLGVMFLFQVRKADVYGNTRHSSQEITAGLGEGALGKNTLYLLWKYREGGIPDSLPFLSSLHVQMKSPSHLEIQVTEKDLAGYIDQNGYVYFDQSGVILEMTDELYGGVPIITGASVGEAVLYQKLPTSSSAQLRTILSLTQLLSYHEVDATEIRFGDNMDITVFIGQVEAELGQDEYLEEKVANMKKILPQLEGQSGTLHLENFTGRNETVSFTPGGSAHTSGVAGGQSESDAQEPETAEGGDQQDTQEPGTVEGGNDQDTQEPGAPEDGDDTGTQEPGAPEGGDNTGTQEPDASEPDDVGTIYPMVFNSSGTLVYNVHVSNGTVVDANGNAVPGCYVNENGHVVDAYMNEFDPTTGELIQN